MRTFILATDDTADLVGEHPGMPSDLAPSARDRRALRWAVVGLAATAAVALGAFLGARAVARNVEAGSPADTVRDFLTAAVAEHDGVGACRYLTPAAVRRVAAVEPPHTPCETALEFARLSLGRENVQQESAIKGLRYRVEQRGARARVTVGAGGATRTFALRRATPGQLGEFQAPSTPWRIHSGVAALVAPRK